MLVGIILIINKNPQSFSEQAFYSRYSHIKSLIPKTQKLINTSPTDLNIKKPIAPAVDMESKSQSDSYKIIEHILVAEPD